MKTTFFAALALCAAAPAAEVLACVGPGCGGLRISPEGLARAAVEAAVLKSKSNLAAFAALPESRYESVPGMPYGDEPVNKKAPGLAVPPQGGRQAVRDLLAIKRDYWQAVAGQLQGELDALKREGADDPQQGSGLKRSDLSPASIAKLVKAYMIGRLLEAANVIRADIEADELYLAEDSAVAAKEFAARKTAVFKRLNSYKWLPKGGDR